jgi:hypothetical protein
MIVCLSTLACLSDLTFAVKRFPRGSSHGTAFPIRPASSTHIVARIIHGPVIVVQGAPYEPEA